MDPRQHLLNAVIQTGNGRRAMQVSHLRLAVTGTLTVVITCLQALRSMLCGHRGSQCAFTGQPGTTSWRMYSTSTLHMGLLEWPAVLAQCRMKTLQPTVLLYDCER